MKILCKNTQLPMSTNLKVNKLGQYLYNNIDSASQKTTSSNTCDVYFTIYYQIPRWDRKVGNTPEQNDVHEMVINISITTYQNKVRVNILEVSPNERTLGSFVVKPEDLENLEAAKQRILSQVKKYTEKAYSEYDFLY